MMIAVVMVLISISSLAIRTAVPCGMLYRAWPQTWTQICMKSNNEMNQTESGRNVRRVGKHKLFRYVNANVKIEMVRGRMAI